MLARSFALVLVALSACWGAAATPPLNTKALLRRGLARIRQNVELAPRYTCRQTIYRIRYFPARDFKNCDEILRAGTKTDFRLAGLDRIRLDVTATSGGEIFSWAGEKAFRSERVLDIVGAGLSSSGDFDAFLHSIFDSTPVLYQFLGFVEENGQKSAEYAYSVPRAVSHYQVQIRANQEAVVPYQGRFRLDTRTADLVFLTVAMAPPPPEIHVCGVETSIRYHRVAVGGATFLLPEETALVENSIAGVRSQNRVTYDSCHEFRSESLFLPSDTGPANAPGSAAPASFPGFPEGLKLRVRLSHAIDSTTSFAGDPLEGTLAKPLSLPGRQTLPLGTRVYGRLVMCKQTLLPDAYLTVGIRWESIETPQGRLPLSLAPLGNTAYDHPLPGGGAYVFRAPWNRVEAGFVTGWKIVESGK
jgi:hypothetical protein